MLEVNFQGPVDLIQQALPAMCAKRWGRIVNILSDTMHQQPIPYSTPEADVHGLTTYGASKAALERFTLGLAAELHGTGVHVNATYPYKICVTEQSSERALAGLRARPDYAESLEMMAEAAYLLIAGELTGVSDSSRRLMQMLQQPLHALDGRTVIGDAWTVPELTGSPS
jgi:NAD(P)-dependent dehydrogenase (short-subunit alcohol dehydrogenase family)